MGLALCASLLLGAAWATTGCSAAYESAVHDGLRQTGRTLAEPGQQQAEAPDGTVASYTAYAMAQSPELRASYERWRAAALRIGPARQLPDPMITYAFYASPVQTRVGPQRHRLSVRQDVPWPTKLTAAADAQSMRARAAQRRFEASALGLRRRVADAWWRLWLVRRSRGVLAEQLEILAGVSSSLRGRLEVGQATLADVSQVDLRRSRLQDSIEGLAEQERSAEAALRAAIGAPSDVPLPTVRQAPPVALPSSDVEALREAVREHPFLRSFALMADANEAQASSLEADRFPRLSFGVDWIETGEAALEVQGSGQDAVILNFGLSVPLWQGAYDEAQRAAAAEAAADRAEGQAAQDAALAELQQALASLRDSYRRVRLYGHTLLPQATSTFESVLGGHAVGRSSVASVLISQRELLELALEQLRARAEHGEAWARLERVVGQPVQSTAAEPVRPLAVDPRTDPSPTRAPTEAPTEAPAPDPDPARPPTPNAESDPDPDATRAAPARPSTASHTHPASTAAEEPHR